MKSVDDSSSSSSEQPEMFRTILAPGFLENKKDRCSSLHQLSSEMIKKVEKFIPTKDITPLHGCA